MIMKFKEFYPVIHAKAWVAPSADVIGNITIGEDSSIWFGCVLRADVNSIQIGDRTNIQDLSIIHVDHDHPTTLGDDITVGHQVMLHGCTIGSGTLIGMSTTILDGAVIGENSIVGAKSLVTSNKKFPPRSLIMGSPAKVIRELSDEEVEGLINHAKRYVSYKNDYI